MADRDITDLLHKVQDAYLDLGEPVTEARLERMMEVIQAGPASLIALNNAVGNSVKVELAAPVDMSEEIKNTR